MSEQQAFPGEINTYDIRGIQNGRSLEKGMALRDYFAGQAVTKLPISFYKSSYGTMFKDWELKMAKDAYRLADAMMEARDK